MLPNPKSSNFPSALKKAREAKKMTRSELAEAAGVSGVMPGRYERGLVAPTMSTWQDLNAALGEDSVEDEIVDFTVDIQDASIEDLISELKARGATKVSLEW